MRFLEELSRNQMVATALTKLIKSVAATVITLAHRAWTLRVRNTSNLSQKGPFPCLTNDTPNPHEYSAGPILV